MSYVLHFWDFPIPHTVQEAERFCTEAHARIRPQNPAFIRLAQALTARYPCLTSFEDDDAACVWTDGPLDGLTDRGRYSLGIVTRYLDEVYPFVVETATSLGLVMYDFQTGDSYLPDGMVVRGGEVLIGNHLGMALNGPLSRTLIERTLFDALLPILARLDFDMNRLMGGLWRSSDEGQQLFRFNWFQEAPDAFRFDIELVLSQNHLKKVIEPMLAAATLGAEKYVATAMSSLALFSLFYRMPSRLAKLDTNDLYFELASVDALRTLAIELRLLAVRHVCPLLRQFDDIPQLAYYLLATTYDAWRILGSKVDVDAQAISSTCVGRHLLSTAKCGGAAVEILIGGVARLPMGILQPLIDQSYERASHLAAAVFKAEKAKLDLCLSLLREQGYIA